MIGFLFLGLTLIFIIIAIGKITWSIQNACESANAIITPAIIGLLVCSGLIFLGYRKLERNKMKRSIIITVVLAVVVFNSNGQSNFPVKIALSNEATAIPFTRLITTPIHPTIQIGTEYFYNTAPYHGFYQTANLGYVFHNYLYQGIYLNTGIGYDFIFKSGFKLKSTFEVGYLHTFSTQDEYQLENGGYVNGTDRGNARIMPVFSLGFGYLFKKENTVASEISLLYKSWVDYPYSPGFIPVMTHINLEIGYKHYLNRRNEN